MHRDGAIHSICRGAVPAEPVTSHPQRRAGRAFRLGDRGTVYYMDRAAGVGNGDLCDGVDVMTKKNILGFIGVCMAVIFLFTACGIVESMPENSQIEDSVAEGKLQTVTGLLHGRRGEWGVYSAEKGEIPLDTSNWQGDLQTSFIQVTYKPGETNELISIQWTDDTVPIPAYGIVIDEAHQVISVNGTVYSYDEYTTIGLQMGMDAYPLATSISDITPEDSVILSIYNQHIYDITINPCSLIITALPGEVMEKLQIYIDGKPAYAIHLDEGYQLLLRNGSYEVIVSAEGYGAVTETIQVTNDTRSLRLDVDFR